MVDLKSVPNSKGTKASEIDLVSLGFSTSRTVVDTVSTSYPFTYAFPAPTFTEYRSSDGVWP